MKHVICGGAAVALVACNLVADLNGYEVVPGVGGGGGGGATGGSGVTSGGAGGEGGDTGGTGGQGGLPDPPCGDACIGEHLWTAQISGNDDEWVTALEVDPATGISYVGGEFLIDITIGTTTRTAGSSGRDIFVAPLDDTGDVGAWVLTTSSSYDQHLSGLTLDGDGNLIGVGYFEQNMNIGGRSLSNSTTLDLLVFEVTPSDGMVPWAKGFGGASNVYGRGVAAHPEGGVVVVGSFTNALDLGGGPLDIFGGPEGFMARLDTDGNHVWSQSFGGTGSDIFHAVEPTPDNGFVVLGTCTDVVNLGGGALPYVGDIDIVVAKYDAAGIHQWSKSFGSADKDEALGLAVDASGRIYIAGEFRGDISFGGDLLGSMGDADAFVAVLDPNGDHLFSERFGDAVYQSARTVVDDTFSNALLGGTFAGEINFGGGALSSDGADEDIFVAKLSFDGTYRYAMPFGNPGNTNQRVDRVDRDGDGNGIIAGTFDGTVNFGGGPRSAQSGDDVFILKLSK